MWFKKSRHWYKLTDTKETGLHNPLTLEDTWQHFWWQTFNLCITYLGTFTTYFWGFTALVVYIQSKKSQVFYIDLLSIWLQFDVKTLVLRSLVDSYWFLLSGQSEARCTVVIEDDKLHEEPEQFRLVLGTPTSESAGAARLGDQTEILITIKDDADSKHITIIDFIFW